MNAFFAKKTSQLRWKRHFSEIRSFDTHSTAYLPPSLILKKFNFFEKKTRFFFQKTQLSCVFEKSSYFSRILRQICYNLVIKNFQFSLGILPEQTASKRKKNVHFESMIILPYNKYGGKNKMQSHHRDTFRPPSIFISRDEAVFSTNLRDEKQHQLHYSI